MIHAAADYSQIPASGIGLCGTMKNLRILSGSSVVLSDCVPGDFNEPEINTS
jgi:hypothetical protein